MYTTKLSLSEAEQGDQLAEFLRQMQFDITAFGRWDSPAPGQSAAFTIPDHEIAYVLKGKVYLSDGENNWVCESGSLLFLEPFVPYEVKNIGEEPVECCCFHFDFTPAYRTVELRELLVGHGDIVFPKQEVPQLSMMFTMLENDVNAGLIGYQAMLTLSLIRVMIYMCRARHAGPAQVQRVADRLLTPREIQIVNDSMLYIEENLARPLKITDISGSLNISENYLYKSFMNVMHLSPSRYLLQYKVKRAEQLLRTGRYSVEHISRLLGFSSLFHFSKTFKDFFGASPKQYLKSINR